MHNTASAIAARVFVPAGVRRREASSTAAMREEICGRRTIATAALGEAALTSGNRQQFFGVSHGLRALAQHGVIHGVLCFGPETRRGQPH
jgi:hypothetical protein